MFPFPLHVVCCAACDWITGTMMTGADVAQLKAYVQGPDDGMQNRDAATVLLHVSHSNLAARFMEIRVDMHVCPHNRLPMTAHSLHPANDTVLQACMRTNLHLQQVILANVRNDVPQTTVDALKTKLMTHCGTSPSAMQLQLKDERGKLLANLDPGRPLGFYSPHDGYKRLQQSVCNMQRLT